jgi:hypothetical protein
LHESKLLADELWILRFPEEWKRLLLELQAEHLRREVAPNSIPVRLLNAALRATVPSLISISRDAAKRSQEPWIYSSRVVPPQFLDPIIREWVRTSFQHARPASREKALALINPEHLRWERKQLDLAAWYPGPNGTAVPEHPDTFLLLPDYLAAHLAAAGQRFKLGEGTRRFYRALKAPWTTSAELISWPPLIFQKGRSEWYFSMVLKLTVQTIAFDPRPVVHCEVTMRRWASLPVRWLPPGNTSVFLRGRVPWIGEDGQAATFQVAPICWKRDATRLESGDTRGGYTWGNGLAPLLKALAPRLDLPDPEALRADPSRYLNPYDQINVGIDFRNGMLPDHAVKAGWGPADRRDIADQVTYALADILAPREPLPKVRVSLTAPSQVPSRTRTTESTTLGTYQQALRRAIGQATGNSLTIDLLYQTDAIRNAAVQYLVHTLDLPPLPIEQAGTELHWVTPEGLSLALRLQPLGELGAGLQLPPSGNRDDRLRSAIRRRCHEVRERLGQASGAAGSLIEIAPRERFDQDADPKFALRLGAAQQGRLSQFVLLDEDGGHGSFEHRIAQAWRDLLRQLGVQLARPAFTSRTWAIPQPLHYVGIWLIKQNYPTAHTGYPQQMPVMVWMASDSDEVKAFAPGFSNWLPYGQALLALAALDVFERRGRNQGQAMQFIEQALLQHVLPLGDVLLLTDAQNLRLTWKWLQNGQLVQDHLRLGVAAPISIDRWPGVRHVQVRTSDGGETPECFGEQPSTQGFPKGLWRMDDRVFASTAGKPATQQHMLGNLSKLHPWRSSRRAYPPKPGTQVWNPSLVELTVASIQRNDDPVLWAAIAHELRFVASHYDEAIIHPLPLHLGDQMEEYVLPMRDGADNSS